MIDREIKDIYENVKENIKLGRNVFLITPLGRAMAGGKVLNIENNILTLSTLEFETKWDISNAKGDKDKLVVNQEVRILGRWDSKSRVFCCRSYKNNVQTNNTLDINFISGLRTKN